MLPGEIFLTVPAQRSAELKRGLMQIEKGKDLDRCLWGSDTVQITTVS
jgi:hypothetical protein